ncbi:DEAD/DEAH box helicase [Marinobacter sp. BSs20148]|uniref:DEAD/DEAH box helicase n=1 Tax=Marinobacter sp. BSs20148 TaxID=490759 RepID=UPI00165190D8|nr:helicase-related protein [Marinobacter sp. BSs20148]
MIDGVCRAPKIVLTDNRKISLKSSVVGFKTYSSIRETIEHGHITYPDFLFRDEIIDHTLSEASKKLSEIRKYRPSAAGLVVAATVAHAEQIATRLLALGELAVMVTHKTPESQKIISDFKTSDDLWIISVGMISEGTDIPRLQVCCHLSRIRTELHFRQVLGRILRRQKEEHSDLGGWLYVLAEPSLTEFAQRIGDDLPEHQVVSFTPKTSGHSHSEKKPEMLLKEKPDTPWDLDIELPEAYNVAAADDHERRSMELSVSEHYWSEVLSLFDERVALHS